MEKPHKVRRLSYASEPPPSNLTTLQTQEHCHSLAEEDLCELLREASCESSGDNGTNGKHVFLQWLLGYLDSSQQAPQSHLSSPTCRQLHGWLILHLGCCMFEPNNESKRDDAKAEITTCRLLLKCLYLIYQRHTVARFLSPNELQETIKAHMGQLIRCVRDRSSGLPKSCEDICFDVQDYCLRSIDTLFNAQVDIYGAIVAECCANDEEEFKDFLLAVLRILPKQGPREDKKVGVSPSASSPSQSTQFPAAQRVLTKLTHAPIASNADGLFHWARIAAFVAHQYHPAISGEPQAQTHLALQNQRNRTQSEWLFELECHVQLQLSSSSSSEPTTGVTIGDQEQTHLLRLALQDEGGRVAARAARCLSQVATVSSKPTLEISSLWVRSMLQVLVGAVDKQIKIQMLPGLRAWSHSQVSGGDKNDNHNRRKHILTFIQTNSAGNNNFERTVPISPKSVVSALVDLLLTTPDHHDCWLVDFGPPSWKSDAAGLLQDLILQVLRSIGDSNDEENSTGISPRDVISICLVFLDESCPEPTHCAVEILHHLFVAEDTSVEAFLPAVQVPDLLRGLAAPLTSLGAHWKCKQKVVEIFAHLSQQRPLNLSHLVRTPPALEGLVRCASLARLRQQDGSFEEEESSTSSLRLLRESSLKILLLMSRDPSHHRILAKQTGLLSVLIRHVRDQEEAVPEEPQIHWGLEEDRGLALSPQVRQEVKSNILLIASAL